MLALQQLMPWRSVLGAWVWDRRVSQVKDSFNGTLLKDLPGGERASWDLTSERSI